MHRKLGRGRFARCLLPGQSFLEEGSLQVMQLVMRSTRVCGCFLLCNQLLKFKAGCAGCPASQDPVTLVSKAERQGKGPVSGKSWFCTSELGIPTAFSLGSAARSMTLTNDSCFIKATFCSPHDPNRISFPCLSTFEVPTAPLAPQPLSTLDCPLSIGIPNVPRANLKPHISKIKPTFTP